MNEQLFQERQKELLLLANTKAGRYSLRLKNDGRVVRIGPHFVHQYLGQRDRDTHVFRAKFYYPDKFRSNPAMEIAKNFTKIQLARESELFPWNKANFYKEFLFHSQLEVQKNLQYPQIFLAEANFPTMLGGAGRWDQTGEATWAGCRGAATSDFVYATYEVEAAFAVTYRIQRVALPVDTSSLNDAATIIQNNLEFSAKYEGGATATVVHFVDTTQSSPASRIVADYNNFNFVSGGSVATPDAGATAKKITGNATALTWINKTGNSLLGVLAEADQANTSPAGIDDWATLTIPNVEVIFTVPAGGNPMIFQGGGVAVA